MLRGIYFLFKIFPQQQNKILFCTRQADDNRLDFKLLQEEILSRNKDIKFVIIACKTRKNFKTYLKFTFASIKSMYHLSTSRICIIDSYWPAASILNHKRNLKIIQIWHALGKIKQSGIKTLGKPGGRNKDYAKILNMHQNYDYVIAGSNAWNPYYCESFGVDESKIKNYGLPRIDYILNKNKGEKEDIKKRLIQEYPSLANKAIILYAPTFRRNNYKFPEELQNIKLKEDYAIIINGHPIHELEVDNSSLSDNVILVKEWGGIDLLICCDYLITDYSAIALEGAIINVKTLYWLYDYEDYIKTNGINIDLYKEMPSSTKKELKDILDIIYNEKYNEEELRQYKEKFLPKELGISTKNIVNLVMENM